MKTTTTSCRSNGNPSNPHHGEPWWQSPTHRRQAKIIDRTLQVCGHMELFQPERDRRREKFGKTERDRAANVTRNKIIRRAHRAAERNQWGVLAFMMREHEWLQGTLFPAAVQTAVSDHPHPKPELPAASPHYSKKAKALASANAKQDKADPPCPFVTRTAGRTHIRTAELTAEYNRIMEQANLLLAAGKMRAFNNLVAKHKQVMLGARPTL
jgi:hypothetical protein